MNHEAVEEEVRDSWRYVRTPGSTGDWPIGVVLRVGYLILEARAMDEDEKEKKGA